MCGLLLTRGPRRNRFCRIANTFYNRIENTFYYRGCGLQATPLLVCVCLRLLRPWQQAEPGYTNLLYAFTLATGWTRIPTTSSPSARSLTSNTSVCRSSSGSCLRSRRATLRIHSPPTSTWQPGRDEPRLLPRCCPSVPTLMPKTRYSASCSLSRALFKICRNRYSS